VALSHDTLRVLYQLGLREEPAPLLEPWGEDGHLFKLTDAAGEPWPNRGSTWIPIPASPT
jgi:hypothetical protein